ncbi:hypothetical protein BDW22DRAFT_380254 [Trametopsis cervina]|nr:hypothetical protein BDW22DRAFT_380254 [Trametopsis cervina]
MNSHIVLAARLARRMTACLILSSSILAGGRNLYTTSGKVRAYMVYIVCSTTHSLLVVHQEDDHHWLCPGPRKTPQNSNCRPNHKAVSKPHISVASNHWLELKSLRTLTAVGDRGIFNKRGAFRSADRW